MIKRSTIMINSQSDGEQLKMRESTGTTLYKHFQTYMK